MDRLAYGKQSIAINLKDKQGIEIVKKLATDAHVIIEPFRTGLIHNKKTKNLIGAKNFELIVNKGMCCKNS